jgi:hypothetical protein
VELEVERFIFHFLEAFMVVDFSVKQRSFKIIDLGACNLTGQHGSFEAVHLLCFLVLHQACIRMAWHSFFACVLVIHPYFLSCNCSLSNYLLPKNLSCISGALHSFTF